MIQAGLIAALAYSTLTQDARPWTLLSVIVLVSVFFLGLLWSILTYSGDQQAEQSPLARSLNGWLVAALIVLPSLVLYDFVFQTEMRWEMYAGMAIPIFVVWMILLVGRGRWRWL